MFGRLKTNFTNLKHGSRRQCLECLGAKKPISQTLIMGVAVNAGSGNTSAQKLLATSVHRPGRSRAGLRRVRCEGHGQAFGENFKEPKNREDGSDVSEFWTQSIASPQSIISKIFARLGGKTSQKTKKTSRTGRIPSTVVKTHR